MADPLPFAPVFYAQNSGQLSLVISLLDAHQVPHFVQGNYYGALRPTAPVPWANERIVMTPNSHATDARQLLTDYGYDERGLYPDYSGADRLRVITEGLLFSAPTLAVSHSRPAPDYPSLRRLPVLAVTLVMLATWLTIGLLS